MRSRRLTALSCLLAAACGPAAATKAPAGQDDPSRTVAAFENVEDDVLRDLATTDRRMAARARISPRDEDLHRLTMGAVLAEDPSLAVVDGTIDPFSFEARGRGLAGARKRLEAAPALLPKEASGMMPSPALERELLVRLVEQETARLEEERALPRSASALLRAIVETWTAPASPQQSAERDRWLARRLREVSAAVAAPKVGPLDVVRARELDDTLDALEHRIDAPGFGQATVELVKLREALEAQSTRPSATATSSWKEVEQRLRAHLGLTITPDELDARLAAVEIELRRRADAATLETTKPAVASGAGQERALLPGTKADGTSALLSRAQSLVGSTDPCVDAVPGSRVRSMAPPPERAAACRLRHAVEAAADDGARAAVFLAMHEHVIVAQWALDVARGVATLSGTAAKHRPLSRPPPDVVARWERVALARPVAAIGAGLAAAILYGKAGDVDSRARRWSKLGETPLDIAERDVEPGQ